MFTGMVLSIDEIDSTETTPHSSLLLLQSVTKPQMQSPVLDINPNTKARNVKSESEGLTALKKKIEEDVVQSADTDCTTLSAFNKSA